MTSPIRCALYDRVSTEMQVKDGLSLDAQRQALTDYALSQGYQIMDFYSDEGITARKQMRNRKELQRLLADVAADKIDLILVTKLDRWFRNIKDYHNTQAILEQHNCNWKTIFEEYDTSTSNGRFAINIMLSVNENECDRDSERIRSVFAYKKSRREHLSGKPPYGYTLDGKKHLTKDPLTSHIVEDGYAAYFATRSKRAAFLQLQACWGAAAPTLSQFQHLFTSPVYMGCRYGIPHYCDAYLSAEKYHALTQKKTDRNRPAFSPAYYFSSLILCPSCGRHLYGFQKKRTLKDGSAISYKYYRCDTRNMPRHTGVCLSENTLEKYLLSTLSDSLSGLQLTVTSSAPPPAYKTDTLHRELDRLNRLFQKGRISENYYDQQYSLLTEQLNAQTATSPKVANTQALSSTAQPLPTQGSFLRFYSCLDEPHKRFFWQSLLSEITLDDSTRRPVDFSFRPQVR